MASDVKKLYSINLFYDKQKLFYLHIYTKNINIHAVKHKHSYFIKKLTRLLMDQPVSIQDKVYIDQIDGYPVFQSFTMDILFVFSTSNSILVMARI